MSAADGAVGERRGIAVVTGAASGIGQAAAVTLVQAGRTVLGADVDEAGLASTARLVAGAPGRFESQPTDVTDDDQCAALIARAGALGPLHTLVNSAGILPADDTVEKLGIDGWDRTFAVNVRAIFLLLRHGVALMRPHGGVVVNVTSVHAYASQPGFTAYAATKGAIVSLTQQLALELAPDGIRVVAVAPGSVDTPMSALSVQRSGAASLSDLGYAADPHAAGRVGSAAEVAAVIAWLTTGAASFVNGTTVRADAALLSAIPAAGR